MQLRKNPKVGRKIAIGATIAGIGGYLAGILTAPKSGKETRAEIADKAGEVKDEVGVDLQIAQDELGVVIKQASAKTVALGSVAREEFNEALLRAKDAQNKTKILLKAVKDGQAEDPELNKAVKQARQAKKNLAKFLKGN